MLFCVIRAGLRPRLASESLEAGQNRLDKILDLIASCKYSIHDLSLAKSGRSNEFFRMNMPFELGLDMGRRKAPDESTNDKKFLIFEYAPHDLKRALSDLSGVDVSNHKGDFLRVIKGTRDFLRVEAGRSLPGPATLQNEYENFLGWMTEKKIFEGHSEAEALDLPTQERLEEMSAWNALGRPVEFSPVA